MDSDSSDDLLMWVGLYFALKRKNRNRPRNDDRRRKWTREWLLKRSHFGHTNLLEELRLTEPLDYRNYLRMDEECYSELLDLLKPLIERQDTVMRRAISAHERLCATLRYLATGRSFRDLEFTCVVSRSALSQIIPETCEAIYNTLKDYIRFPTTTEEWETIAHDFLNDWQFPNCVGAVDGKHVQIIPPPGSGSFYYNYKGSHSIVLMAIVNAKYEFILADVGVNGRISDGGVIDNTEFYDRLKNNQLKLPPPKAVPMSEMVLNHVFISDEAFTLRPDFLKPFNQRELDYERRIYNYRLSRARRVVENAFGILANRFQIFRRPIPLKLQHTKIVVMACCALHNYLRNKSRNYLQPADLIIEDIERGEISQGTNSENDDFVHLKNGKNRNASCHAKDVREKFKTYFNSDEGKVEWQDRMIAPT